MKKEKQKRIRIVIAHESQVIREGLRQLLSHQHDFEVLAHTSTIPETIRIVGELQPCVVILNIHMSGYDGLKALRLIRGEWPECHIICYTLHHEDDLLFATLKAGASAYLTVHCDANSVCQAVRTAAIGGTFLHPDTLNYLLQHMSTSTPATIPTKEDVELTEREREVLQRVAYGDRNKEIAARLSISEPTVKSHLANIFYKFNVDSRASAVAIGIEKGLVTINEQTLR